MKDTGVDLQLLMEATAFYSARFQAIHEGRADIDRSIANHQEEIADVDAAMQQLPTLRTATSLVVLVRVEVPRQTEGALAFSYWMQQAGWTPSYNVRVHDVDDPMRLECQAMVTQNTGEAWEDVSLTVATGSPSQNRTKPELQPWYIDGSAGGTVQHTGVSSANAWLKAQPYNPSVREVRGQLFGPQGNPLVGARVVSSDGRAQAVTDINGFYNLAVTQGATSLSYQNIGYSTQTMAISSHVMNVALAPTLDVMDAVEVVADEAEESLFDGRPADAATLKTTSALWPWTLDTPRPRPGSTSRRATTSRRTGVRTPCASKTTRSRPTTCISARPSSTRRST